MSFFEFDYAACAGDGICAMECPMGLIAMGADGKPAPVEGAEEACIRCGHCVVSCPKKCLSVGEIRPESLRPLPESSGLDPESTLLWMSSRYSTRCFKEKPVPRAVVESCVEAARHAPTVVNSQAVKWMIFEDSVDIRRMAVLCAEHMRKDGIFPSLVAAMDAGHDGILRSAPRLAIAHMGPEESHTPLVDCAIALTYFELAAHAHGIGCCWAGIFMHAAAEYQPLREFINLPAGQVLQGALMFGYPRFGKKGLLPSRRPAGIVWR